MIPYKGYGKGYGFLMLVWIVICKFITILNFPNAKLIRYPFFLRVSGEFHTGKGLTTGFFNRFDIFSDGILIFGDRVQINDSCHIACAKSISIGTDCLIASRVYITDHDHSIPEIGKMESLLTLVCAPVSIGARVWIGEGVAVLKGVTIGDDVVIGANSVVTRNIPSGAIVAGVPAKILRMRK